ncbi:hypothetical protein DSUL_150111 [Desulfovibrionales bacterium]
MYDQIGSEQIMTTVEADIGKPDRHTAPEAKRRSQTVQVRQLEAEVTASRGQTAVCTQTVLERQERLRYIATEERQLLDELKFLEEELAGQEGKIVAATARLKDKLAKVERLARQMEFVKGELEVLVRQVDACKDTVPDKVTGIQHLDVKITGTAKELTQLAGWVRNAEKDFKVSYYEKKRELRRKHDPY